MRKEVEKIQNQMNAGRSALEEKESMEALFARESAGASCLGFERCKDQIRAVHPDLPLQSLDLGHEIYEGRIVKPQAGAPLEDAEIVFSPPTSGNEENDQIESDSLDESQSIGSE